MCGEAIGSRHRLWAIVLLSSVIHLTAGCLAEDGSDPDLGQVSQAVLQGGWYVPDTETTTTGTKTGSYTATRVDDTTFETLTEATSSGVKRLDHRWQINGVPAGSFDVKVIAKRGGSSGDTFQVTYSVSAGASCSTSYQAIGAGCTVAATTDVTCTGTATLAATSTVCVRVLDSITTADTTTNNAPASYLNETRPTLSANRPKSASPSISQI